MKKAPICGSESIKLPAYILVDQEAESSGQNQDRDKPQVCPPVSDSLSLTKLHLLKVAQSLQMVPPTLDRFHRHEPVGGEKHLHPNHNKFIINKLEMEETKCGNNEQFLDANDQNLTQLKLIMKSFPCSITMCDVTITLAPNKQHHACAVTQCDASQHCLKHHGLKVRLLC